MKSYPTMLAGVLAMNIARASEAAEGGTISETTYRDLKIGDNTFQVGVPYKAGHTLNENEANVLNQTYAENVRNNVAGKIRSAKEAFEKDEANAGQTFSIDTYMVAGEEEGTQVTLRAHLQDYADGYEFGARAVRTSEPADPVEREARSIAREMLNSAIKAKGNKVKDIPAETYEATLKTLAARADVVKEAKRRVDQRSKIGGDELDLDALLAGDTSGEVEVEAEGETTEG